MTVLCYSKSNKSRKYENYAHYLLLLFYPIRNEADFKVAMPPGWTNKFAEPGVIDTVNRNRAIVELFS